VLTLASSILTAQVLSAMEAWPCAARCASSQLAAGLDDY